MATDKTEADPSSDSIVDDPPAVVASETTWRDSLPEDIRGNENFQKYSSLESFAKGHLNAVGMLGKPVELKVPEGNDERAEFYNKLGRPEVSSGYEFNTPDDVPEHMKAYADTRLNSFRDMCHSEGMSAAQATATYDWYMNGNKEVMSKMETERTAELASMDNSLKTEWGEMYAPHLAASHRALEKFGDEDLVRYLEESGLGNHPSMIKAFFEIGKGMMGDKFIEESQDSGGATPAEMDKQISSIQANPAYWNADSPERTSLVREMEELMKRKHPEPPT